jgi:universal stress protein F
MKRVLVAIDPSDDSPLVLARAVELARAFGAKLRLLSVAQVPPVVTAPGFAPIHIDTVGVLAAAEASLRRREGDVPPALRDGVVVEVGDVSSVVCSVARAYDADLVVLGAHRHGMLARMLGTTAARIVNHIDRPVIVVRPLPTSLEEPRPLVE